MVILFMIGFIIRFYSNDKSPIAQFSEDLFTVFQTILGRMLPPVYSKYLNQF